MSINVNTITFGGNVARDPELSYTPTTQTAVCRFAVACNRPKKNGEDQGADFLNVTTFGKRAENCEKYLQKGSEVLVVGKIQTGSYTNKEGAKVYTTEIVASEVHFGQRTRGSSGSSAYGDMPEGSGSFAQPTLDGAAPVAPTENVPRTTQQIAIDDIPEGMMASEDDIPF